MIGDPASAFVRVMISARMTDCRDAAYYRCRITQSPNGAAFSDSVKVTATGQQLGNIMHHNPLYMYTQIQSRTSFAYTSIPILKLKYWTSPMKLYKRLSWNYCKCVKKDSISKHHTQLSSGSYYTSCRSYECSIDADSWRDRETNAYSRTHPSERFPGFK